MANLVSDVIKCYRCDFWRRASGEWGWCSIKLGSELSVKTNASDGWGSLCCEVIGIQTQEGFFCANFRSFDDSCPDQVLVSIF